MEHDYGQFLKSLRIDKGLTRDEIADYLCYSVQIISNWERGTTLPPMTSWDGICKLYNLNIDDFLNCQISTNYVEYSFDAKLFAKNLRKLRKKSSLTQIDIANAVDVNHKTVSFWESGNSFPTLDVFIKLTELFSVSPIELYYAVKIEKPVETPNEEIKRKTPSLLKPLIVIASSLVVVAAIIVGTIFGVAANRNSLYSNINQYDSLYGSSSGGTTSEQNGINNNGEVSSNTGVTSTTTQDPYTNTGVTSTTTQDPYISYSFNTLKLKCGETYNLSPSYYPNDSLVTYESLDESIVTVNSSGLVTAIKKGKTKIKSSISDSVFNYLIVRVDDYSSLPVDNGKMNNEQKAFFDNDKTGKVYARFYFEDKISVLYEEWFNEGDDFTYNFVNPRFGPFKGFDYSFLGWDINDDGVVDSLPTKINSNLDAVAVYNKTPTSDPDFVNMDENGISSFNTDYTYIGSDDVLIVPSIEYYLRIDDFSGEYLSNISINETIDCLINVNTIENGIRFKRLVLLEGIEKIEPNDGINPWNEVNYSIYASDGLDYLRLPKSLVRIKHCIKCENTNINNEYVYIIPFTNYGIIDGNILNEGLRFSDEFETLGVTRFYPNIAIVSNCSNLKYLDFSHLVNVKLDAENIVINCPNLERIRLPEQIKTLGNMENTKISFLEVDYGDNPQGFKNISSDRDITIVIPANATLWFNADISEYNYYFMFLGSIEQAKEQALEYIDNHPNCFGYFYSNDPNNGEWTYDQNHSIILGN